MAADPALWAYPSRRGGGISGRLSITLSTKPLSAIAPIEDELDEDFAEYARAVTA